MKAKEQFKELGYIFSYNQDKTVMQYEKKERQWREEGQININFDLEEKTIEKHYLNSAISVPITLEELQAINKQIEELGWHNE